MNLQVLREAREAAGKTILRLRDRIQAESRDFNGEERSEWDKANKAFDDNSRQIDMIERGEQVSAALSGRRRAGIPGAEDVRPGSKRNKPIGDAFERDQNLATQAWFRRQSGRPLTDEHRRACQSLGFRPGAKYLNIRLAPNPANIEYRAQSTTTTAGGYTIQQGFVNNLEVALKQWNAIRRCGAEVIRTDTGNPLPWPTIDDTGNAGTLLAENTTVGASVDMTFGQTTFNAYKFSSGLVLVSAELEQDNAVGLVDRMGTLLGERVGRGSEGYFTTGTGSSQPQGIVTGSTLGVTAASATAVTADELIDLFHSVDPAYRNDPSFGWMMKDSVLKVVRKLKDSNGRYLWSIDMDTGITGPAPGTLLGAPLTINQSMASMTTGQKTIIVGAMSKFKVRDAGVVRIRRLVERYGDIDQIGYICFMRSDSHLLDAGQHPIKYLVQA
ncbi:MAG TPA: phage major capsid protein [Gemmataceae bacterium]|jgi:HK97 family phage major capsid protein|nr:phage major capsid protein [Gemmataceae bacterium]